MNGWILLHRKIWESRRFYGRPTALAVWIWLLTHSNDKGIVLCGRKQIADDVKVSDGTVYGILQRFRRKEGEDDPIINIESNNKFSIITICNWRKYQDPYNRRLNNEATTKLQRSYNEATLIKNKNIYNTPLPPTMPVRERSEVEVAIIKFLRSQPSIQSPEGYIDWLIKTYGTKHLPKLLTLEFSKWREHLQFWQEQESGGRMVKEYAYDEPLAALLEEAEEGT